MSEVIFILTTLFVAYVVYEVVGDKENNSTTKAVDNTPEPKATESVSAEKPTESEEKAETAKEVENENSLRNPLTGEIAKIPNNYRFSKRWIKEALVAEGLLDKIYKNSELDDETNAKIKAALESLKAIEKYQT